MTLRISFYFLLLLVNGCQSNSSAPAAYTAEPVLEAIPFAEGIITTGEHDEFDIAFTPDGRTAYFTRRVGEEPQKIFVTNWEKGQWTPPVLASFSTDRDETPSISPDGKYFFFGSQRPIPGKENKGGFDMNVWMMEATENGWSEPQPLPAPINYVQEKGENWPTVNNNFFFTNDNSTYYFTTMQRGDSTIKVFTTQKEGTSFSEPTPIAGLFEDPALWKYSAVLSPDGNYLVFNSYGAPGGAGGEDIYVSQKTASGWSPAKSIGPKINTTGEESSPRFSRDGQYFFFCRAKKLDDDNYGTWSIHFIDVEALALPQLFPNDR